MTTFIVSPAERPPITSLGQTGALPELVGADVIWEGHKGLAGAQRKEISDLISSVRPTTPGAEPRLGKEVAQLKSSVAYAFLIVEGTPAWDREGNLQSQYQKWTIKNHNGILLSVQAQGIMVLTSRNALETCSVIEHLAEWTQKPDHVSSLLQRPKPQSNGWGRLSDRDTAISVYSGIPGCGVELAARIFDAGLKLLKPGVTVEELMSVRGIGKPTAEKIVKAITG